MRRSGNADFLCALTSGGTLHRRGETTHTTQGSIKKAKRSIALPFLENYSFKTNAVFAFPINKLSQTGAHIR
jgi:hypothetical protein